MVSVAMCIVVRDDGCYDGCHDDVLPGDGPGGEAGGDGARVQHRGTEP